MEAVRGYGGITRPHQQIRVTRNMREDLQTSQKFLVSFNGVSFLWEELKEKAELQVLTDAAVSLGFGIYFVGTGAQRSGLQSGYLLVGKGPDFPGIFSMGLWYHCGIGTWWITQSIFGVTI